MRRQYQFLIFLVVTVAAVVSLVILFSGGPQATNVANPNVYGKAKKIGIKKSFSLASRPVLNPVAGQNLQVIFWFKTGKLPQPGERLILLRKLSAGGLNPVTGYAVSVTNKAGRLLPEIFWRGSTPNELGGQLLERKPRYAGGWNPLGEISLRENHWYCLILSYSAADQAVGVYSFGAAPKEQKFVNHGGISTARLNVANKAALIFGASEQSIGIKKLGRVVIAASEKPLAEIMVKISEAQDLSLLPDFLSAEISINEKFIKS